MNSYDVLDRIAAANPVAGDAPSQAWSKAVLLDAIDTGRGDMTKLEPIREAVTETGGRRRRVRIAAVAAAFATVLGIIGIAAWLTSGGGSGDAVSPAPTTAAPTTSVTTSVPPTTAAPVTVDAAAVASSFLEAMGQADIAAAAALLAPGAAFEGGIAASTADLEPLLEWRDAIAYSEDLEECDAVADGPPARAVCTWTASSMLGRAAGVEPVAGTYELQISSGGLVEKLVELSSGLGGWEAFREFMQSTAPAAVAGMYESDMSPALTAGSRELWREHAARFLAAEFYVAFRSGDTDAALWLASSPRVVEFQEIIQAFGVVVNDISCESVDPGVTVRCTTTHTDDFSSQVGGGYTWTTVGEITIGSTRLVTNVETADDDPIFEIYVEWLDETEPAGWREMGCRGTGWLTQTDCVGIMIDSGVVQTWLATDPDLSSLGA